MTSCKKPRNERQAFNITSNKLLPYSLHEIRDRLITSVALL